MKFVTKVTVLAVGLLVTMTFYIPWLIINNLAASQSESLPNWAASKQVASVKRNPKFEPPKPNVGLGEEPNEDSASTELTQLKPATIRSESIDNELENTLEPDLKANLAPKLTRHLNPQLRPKLEDMKRYAPWDAVAFAAIDHPHRPDAGVTSLKEKPEFDSQLAAFITDALSKAADSTDFYCPHEETLFNYFMRVKKKKMKIRDTWDRFYCNMSTCDLYRENDPNIKALMHDLATLPITHAVVHEGGTQVKMVVTFSNHKKAMLKPLRFGIGYENNPNHYYFDEFERANAEVAAFHLDR